MVKVRATLILFMHSPTFETSGTVTKGVNPEFHYPPFEDSYRTRCATQHEVVISSRDKAINGPDNYSKISQLGIICSVSMGRCHCLRLSTG